MRVLTLMILLFFIGCSSNTKRSPSFWETQKTNFRYQNKKEFVSDSVLATELKSNSFNKIKHPLFDSTLGTPVYLYSWQDRDPSKNEFTVIEDDGEHGLKILYCILSKTDSLLSCTDIAGQGGEDGYLFETRSKFLNKDTLLSIAAITRSHDEYSNRKIIRTKGDSTFSWYRIDYNGNMIKKVFKEITQLNFEKANKKLWE